MNNINIFIYYSIAKDIKKCFNIYGIEGTEQKINELYELMPEVKRQYLDVYNYFLKG